MDLLGSETTQVMSIAAPIKAMLLSLGVQPEDFDRRSKERTIGWIGASPRLLMQSLGDWGRSVNQNLWLSILETRMAAATAKGYVNLVIDDVRLPSEVSALRRKGGLVIKVTRPGVVPPSGNIERASDLIDADFTVVNNGSVSTLRDNLHEIIADLLG